MACTWDLRLILGVMTCVTALPPLHREVGADELEAFDPFVAS